MILLALGLAAIPLMLFGPEWGVIPAFLLILSELFAARLFRKAFRISFLLGLATPWLVFLGGLSFVAGTVWGALGGGGIGHGPAGGGSKSDRGTGENSIK